MTALGKAIAKGYKATHDGVTKLYRKVTGKFGMTSNELIASGDDVGRISSHIAAELPRAGTRGGVSVERLSEFRNLPGKAAGNGKNITGNWIKGTENQAGFFPKSIADKMRNNNYNNFNGGVLDSIWILTPDCKQRIMVGLLKRPLKTHMPIVILTWSSLLL